MPPLVASVVCAFGILALFMLDRDRKVRTSWALWLPIVWFLIAGSRHVSVWLQTAPSSASPDQYLEGSPLDRNVYILILAAGIIVLLGRQNAVARILRRNWPILLFVLYCAISVIWSDYPGVATKRWIKSLGDYVMVLILLTDHDRADAIKHVLARVGLVLLPVSILLIKYYPDLGRSYASHWEGTQFFVGVASDKNMLGMVCLVFGFAATWRVLQAWRGPRRERARILIVHGTILAMSLWLLKLSNSMTSFACFALISGLIAVNSFLKIARKRAVLNFLVAAVVFVCFSILFLDVGAGILRAMGRNPTLTGRTDIWRALLAVPVNPILGTGFESFWLGDRLQRVWESGSGTYGINESHNGYLEVYLNLGWIGVALVVGLMATGYRNILRLLDRDPEAGRLRLGYFVIAVVYNFTEAAIRSTDLVWIAFLLAIVALPETTRARVPVMKARPARNVLVEAEGIV